MKSKLLIFSILFFSQKLMAQFNIIQPEVFRLAINSNTPCSAVDIGKIFYNSNIDRTVYCIGTSATSLAKSFWEGTSDINYFGKVGIYKITPSDELDISGHVRFYTLSVNEKIGINTSMPTEKLELVDRSITIKSTADEKSWQLINSDVADRLEFREMSQNRISIGYGGNVCIGCLQNTAKLRVDGNVNYTGGLSVEGKGILVNTNASQLVMITVNSTPTPNNSYVIGNACVTIGFIFPQNTFSATPAVFLGGNVSATPIGQNLIKSIINVNSSGGTIQICNTTSSIVSNSSQTYSITAIGQ